VREDIEDYLKSIHLSWRHFWWMILHIQGITTDR